MNSDENKIKNPYQGIVDFICIEIAEMRNELERVNQHRDILAEAMSEIKATIDGDSNQDIKAIVYGCLDEIKSIEKQARENTLDQLTQLGQDMGEYE